MGCDQSREEDACNKHDHPRPASAHAVHHLAQFHSSSLSLTSNNTTTTMGAPPAAHASTARLDAQHERLILELLPFADAGAFQAWLQSSSVRGAWGAFCRAYLRPALSRAGPVRPEEPDKEATAKEARQALDKKAPRFLGYHPDKAGWTPQDHSVRFVVTVIADGLLTGVWSKDDWRKRDMQVCRAVYEVLSFLRSSAVVVGGDGYDEEEQRLPPSYHA